MIKIVLLATIFAIATVNAISLQHNECVGLPDQQCFVNKLCRWCPAGMGGGACAMANAKCNCSQVGAMTNVCAFMKERDGCTSCPSGFQGSICVDGPPSTCDCTKMMEHSCIAPSFSHCHWCPQASQGGKCLDRTTACDCSVMTQNVCVSNPATCTWIPLGAMGGSCVSNSVANATLTEKCATFTMNECSVIPQCHVCPIGAAGGGVCKRAGSQC